MVGENAVGDDEEDDDDDDDEDDNDDNDDNDAAADSPSSASRGLLLPIKLATKAILLPRLVNFLAIITTAASCPRLLQNYSTSYIVHHLY